MFIKKTLILFLIFIFIVTSNAPVFSAYILIPDFLCEMGIKLYQQGRLLDALEEFKKALLVNPSQKEALQYINLINRHLYTGKPYAAGTTLEPAVKSPYGVIEEPSYESLAQGRSSAEPSGTYEPLIEELISTRPSSESEITAAGQISTPSAGGITPIQETEKEIIKTLNLDESIKSLQFPIEIEVGKSITIVGKNISRFLCTQPEVLTVQGINENEIQVTGRDLGYAYLHIWDEQDRWTLEFLTTPYKPKGLTLEEEMRVAEEKTRNLRLRYSFRWSTFETGRRINSLKQSSVSLQHQFGLEGPMETPYGDLDFRLAVSSLESKTELTYFTLGLLNGKIGRFKGFNIHTFDFSPGISNLALSGSSLRGVYLSSPVAQEKLYYHLFWGRQSPGKYNVGLAPGVTKSLHSFLSGLALNYNPKEKQNYNFSIFHGWGRDRSIDLNDYGYDLKTAFGFSKWSLNPELAYDSNTFASRLNYTYNFPKLSLISELRNTSKEFRTMTGLGDRAGEVGLLTNVNYDVTDNFAISSRLNLYRDRLFANVKNPQRWNEDLNLDTSWRINPLTTLRTDYNFQNDLGKISPFRSYGAGAGLYRTFEWKKDINTYINYRYTQNKNFSTPILDYRSNKIMSGLRFNLIGSLGYFIDKEISWIEALAADEKAQPHALQTGLDWNSRIFNSHFYDTFRLLYRDEEEAGSAFSFLSGEDYVELSNEIAFRPKPDFEAYFNTRLRNVWAENPGVRKHLDLSLYSGLRYIWDTGLHWDSVGNIEGYVFKDLNSDGLRQRDEPPVQGVKIWLGKEKSQITDEFGYFKFTKISAKKAYVNIDSTTIPSGFALTVPSVQETAVVHRGKAEVSFGIICRTEITGYVFEDADGDNQPGPKDKGLSGVILKVNDGTEIVTDNYGRYTQKMMPGKYRISLDLNSLPPNYLPTIPIFQDIELADGDSYNYNIPLNKTQ